MKKKALTAALLATLLITAITIPLFTNNATANPTPPAPPLKVDIISPQNGRTYRTLIEVTFKYSEPLSSYWYHTYYYILNGERVAFYPKESGGIYHTTLPMLPEGNHTLAIVVNAREAPGLSGYGGTSVTVRFHVNYVAPTVTVLPIENATGTGNDIALDFRVIDYSLTWVSYSLDGEENVTISSEALAQTAIGPIKTWSGNLSFAKLAGGPHNLTIYAGNEVGYVGASEAFCFTVAQNAEPIQPPLYSQLMLSATVASAVAVSVLAGVFLYFKLHKRKLNP